MGYGFGYGNKTPQSAKDLAEALKAGKNLKRTNCAVVNGIYYLAGSPIAVHIVDPSVIAQRVASALAGKEVLPTRAFSFAGWPTEMTARHLNALGVKAEVRRVGRGKKRRTVVLLNGREVIDTKWYTLDDLEALPLFVEAPDPPRRPFVNLTISLFA